MVSKKQYLGRFPKDEYDLVKGRKLAGVIMETDERRGAQEKGTASVKSQT